MLNFFKASDGHIRSSAILGGVATGGFLLDLLKLLPSPFKEILVAIIAILSIILFFKNKPK